MAQKLILDADPGRDDAVAFMLAALSPEIELLGVSCVNGNRPVWECTENALRVFDLIGIDIPVYEGAALPLLTHLDRRRPIAIPRVAPCPIEGSLLEIPEATSKKRDTNAIQWLIETLMASDNDIVLAPIGPMTNIALAMRTEPRINDKIQEIIFMGGGSYGNVSPTAEFNIWMDPEAAKIVLQSGIKNITMVGLDATYKANVTRDECNELIAMGTAAARAAGEFTLGRIQAGEMAGVEAAPIHDALVTCAVIDRTVISTEHYHVAIETMPGLNDGRTVIDAHDGHYRPIEPNVHVALDADREKFVQMLKDILSTSC